MNRKGKVTFKKFLKVGSRQSRPQLYSPREKMQNCIWIFKLGDSDDHPSIPHAHAQEVGYRLDAWSGDIYSAGNERTRKVGKLTPKELRKLHRDQGFLRFAKKQIDWYRTEYPHIEFFVPEWFEIMYMKMCGVKMNRSDDIGGYVFLGKAIIKKQ